MTSTDNLDFRHHSYKDMRQVGTAGGQIRHGLGSSVNKSMGWDPVWGWNTLGCGILRGGEILGGEWVGSSMWVGTSLGMSSFMRDGIFHEVWTPL